MKLKTYGVIYKITNKIDNKIYIGQTTGEFNCRYSGGNWWKHTSNRHLKYSVSKYGIESFYVNRKLDIAFSKEELDEKEIYWIKHYNSTNSKFGYNKKDGGAKGKPNAETLVKMTIANRKIGISKKGIPRKKEIMESVLATKLRVFLKRFPKSESESIQLLLNNGIRKENICEIKDISEWELNKIIKFYNLNYETTSSMKGNFGEKHHNYGKQNTEESKKKAFDTYNKKFHDRFDSEVDKINIMLKAKVSISEISRIYGCSRKLIPKVIKAYGLESYGFNVKKHKIV